MYSISDLNYYIQLKRFVRIMNIVTLNNVHYVYFLVSSNRNLMQIFTNNEYKILLEITSGNNQKIIDLINKLNIKKQEIVNFIKKFNEHNLFDISKNKFVKNNPYDRHDLFFDMCFKKMNFSKDVLNKKTILIIGCGGIGNNIVLMMSRSGIKNFILVDNDIIEETNLTRQFLFLKEDIKQKKIEVLKRKIKEYDSNINVVCFDGTFDAKLFEKKFKKYKIDFAVVSADSPQTIAINVYNLFSKLKIPFTTIVYLNDFGITGPIIDDKNLKYEKFVSLSKSSLPKKINQNYQAPSFGPLNSFISSFATYEIFKYFFNKEQCNTYNKKIIINFNTLTTQVVDFSNLTIGIFNSSSNLSYKYKKRIKETIKIFRENNLKILLGNLTNKKGDYRSGSITERSNEFNKLLKESNIMLSMIGGFNSSSLLNNINYNLIKSKNIKIVGCSDTTSILLAVYKKTGLSVYYGPSFLMSYYEQDYIKDFNLNNFINRVICDWNHKVNLPCKVTFEKYDWKNEDIKNKKLSNNEIKVINFDKNKTIRGRLIGGNLNTMASLIGTDLCPKF